MNISKVGYFRKRQGLFSQIDGNNDVSICIVKSEYVIQNTLMTDTIKYRSSIISSKIS